MAGPMRSEVSVAQRKLLDAARDAFGAKGFHGTTTRDIAAAAGLSPAAVYVHHRSKESLLYAISLAGHESTLGALHEAAATSTRPPDQLTAVVRAFVLGHTREHTTARVVNYELDALSPEHRVVIDGLRHQIQELVRGVLLAGVASGDFECPDVGMTTNAIMGMSIDVARWYDAAGPADPIRIAEHSGAMAVRMAGYRSR